jgi:hypothetical protein
MTRQEDERILLPDGIVGRASGIFGRMCAVGCREHRVHQHMFSFTRTYIQGQLGMLDQAAASVASRCQLCHLQCGCQCFRQTAVVLYGTCGD